MVKTLLKIAIGLTAVAFVAETVSEAIKTSEVSSENKAEKAKDVAKNIFVIGKNHLLKDVKNGTEHVVFAYVIVSAMVASFFASHPKVKRFLDEIKRLIKEWFIALGIIYFIELMLLAYLNNHNWTEIS